MKRLISSALILGLFSFTSAGLVGCGDEAKVKEQETVSGPGGKTVTTDEKTIKSSGENPPTNSSGEKAK